ncbi:GNAT family N-acetyltransferase [Paractinoplanes abujensis]|uniref:Ribosomal protein S18 acetylase RimI-like enzyme n=1 Tax=Paractinoplanes abujensis TaxID=882441 RepID=A0A7W7CSQ6_9ACTN|nr:GNAT family N-acetyltransferase [Actinoplanes abujensis]MBB4692598.1 ribosomal protein S18 acetylase RimI-like enzyme [Actinoplanes abujensis]
MNTDWRCLPVPAADAETLIPLLHDAEEDDDRIRAALRDPTCRGYVARAGSEPVGAAVMRWSDQPELLYLAVAATARRRGHGRRIVAALQAELPPGRTMLVGTANCALDNIAFYQRCGFRMHSVKRDYFAYIDPPLTENGIPMQDMIVFSYEP